MKCYLVAGEKSSDAHAAKLVSALRKHQPDALFRGVGGEKMQQNGVIIFKSSYEFSTIGLMNTLSNPRKFLRLRKHVQQDILQWNPNIVIFADGVGRNLKISKSIHRSRAAIVYFIAPNMFTHRSLPKYAGHRYVQLWLCIFPHEVAYYQRLYPNVYYIGNPLMEDIPLSTQKTPNTVALLPGSRIKEVERLAPILAEVCQQFHTTHPALTFTLTLLSHIPDSLYAPLRLPNVKVFTEEEASARVLLSKASLAICASGTASLEAALCNTPHIVLYKLHPIEMLLGNMFLKYTYFSLVNIIANARVIEELIQQRCTAKNTTKELLKLLQSDNQGIFAAYADIRVQLTDRVAAAEGATRIMDYVKQQTEGAPRAS